MSAPADTAVPARCGLFPRQRAQRSRNIQYAILLVLVIVVASAADWGQIVDALRADADRGCTDRGHRSRLSQHNLVYGRLVRRSVAGTVLALMRLSSVGPYRWMATAYIEFFRGLPAIVVLIAFSLLPLAFAARIPFEPYGTVWLALGMVGSAYMAETIRAESRRFPEGTGRGGPVASACRLVWRCARSFCRRRSGSSCRRSRTRVIAADKGLVSRFISWAFLQLATNSPSTAATWRTRTPT